MKFGQLMSYYKRNISSKNSTKMQPENYFQALLCLLRIKHNFCCKMKFLKQATYINSKAIKICPNQHADLDRTLFTEGSLKIKKDLELVSRPHFS